MDENLYEVSYKLLLDSGGDYASWCIVYICIIDIKHVYFKIHFFIERNP